MRGPVERLLRLPRLPLVAAAVLGALAVAEMLARADGSGTDLSVALLLALAATAPLAVAREQPTAAAGVVTVATALTVVVHDWPTVGGALAQLVVLHLLLRHWRARRAARRRAASRLAAADSRLELAMRGERARIARELHDVVAHHISMIVVQAETARLTTPGLPADGARRLVAIGDTARAALTEMRRLLGVLREDAGAEPTRAPQPGLPQLNELIDEARDSTGASTRLIVRGQVGPLDPGVELTAYRIVQEALTNARRHARGAAVDVELHYAQDALHLRIRDNGPGPVRRERGADGPREPAGHGLLGMRERAATVGGTLHAGPAPVSGFLVEATLPATLPAEPAVSVEVAAG